MRILNCAQESIMFLLNFNDSWTTLNYLLLVVFACLLIFFRNYFKAVYLGLTVPGPRPLPILGNVLIISDPEKLIYESTNFSKLYGPVARVWVSIVPFFFIVEPKDVQVIIGNNRVSEKNMFYRFLHNFVGEGLITNNGAKWKTPRKLIQPYFHQNFLKSFCTCFAENSKLIVDRLSNETDVNITTYINRTVLEILHQSILGISLENFENSPFRKGKVNVTDRAMKPWLLLNSLFKMTNAAKNELKQKHNLQTFTKKILESKLSEDGIETKPPENLMEMLIEISRKHPEFTQQNIINEACTFMLAGQDSVGASTVFTLYLLAQNQEVQRKVVEELKDIFSDDYNRSITFEDLSEMKYLEQCIKETMRLYPPVPMLGRKLLQDVTLGNVTLPSGTNVFIAPFATHRLPHIFPDPLKYDPDRFSNDNLSKLHPYAYIPFSGGPRNCIGYKFGILEMKMIITEILRNYHLDLCPGHENLSLIYRVTIRAKGGVWLRLNKRKLNDIYI